MQKLPGEKITRLQGIGGLPMNLNRPDVTETVKFENYTKKSLQSDSDPAADTAFLSSLYILRNNGCAGWNDRKSDEQYQ